MVATTIVNQRFDEASQELRDVLDELETSQEFSWIDTFSRPVRTGPAVRDASAVRVYNQEVNLPLARALLALQERVKQLESSSTTTSKTRRKKG